MMIISTICWKPITFQAPCEVFVSIILFNSYTIPKRTGLREVKWLAQCCMAGSKWQTWHKNPHAFFRTTLWHKTRNAFLCSICSFSTTRSNNYGPQFLWAGQFIPFRNLPWPALASSPADGRWALVVITDCVVLFIYVFTIQLDIVS